MRPESLRLLQQAVRINPHVTVASLAADKAYGEAMVDLFCHIATGGAKFFGPTDWDTLLEELDCTTTPLGVYMDTPEVRALIRAQEAANANV